MAVAWLIIAVALLFVELHHLAFFALFGSIGAAAAAVLALVDPDAYTAQGVLFVAVSIAGVIAVRPVISRVYEHRHPSGRVAIGVHGGLVGQEAITLDVVDGHPGRGHARLAGERWLAVSGDGRAIDAGRSVTVTAVQGTTLVVWPVDGLFFPVEPIEPIDPSPDALAPPAASPPSDTPPDHLEHPTP
jgi:membrane protein implicated in regulation of membrane protease activity